MLAKQKDLQEKKKMSDVLTVFRNTELKQGKQNWNSSFSEQVLYGNKAKAAFLRML